MSLGPIICKDIILPMPKDIVDEILLYSIHSCSTTELYDVLIKPYSKETKKAITQIELLDETIECIMDKKSTDLFQYYLRRIRYYVNCLNKFEILLEKINQLRGSQLPQKKVTALLWALSFNRSGWRHCLFGGFVRDLFTDDDFSDIDIWYGYKDCDWLIYPKKGKVKYLKRPYRQSHYALQAEHVKAEYKWPVIDEETKEIKYTVDVTMGGAFHMMAVDYECNSLYIEVMYSLEDEFYIDFELGVRVSFPTFPKIDMENDYRSLILHNGRVKQPNHSEFISYLSANDNYDVKFDHHEISIKLPSYLTDMIKTFYKECNDVDRVLSKLLKEYWGKHSFNIPFVIDRQLDEIREELYQIGVSYLEKEFPKIDMNEVEAGMEKIYQEIAQLFNQRYSEYKADYYQQLTDKYTKMKKELNSKYKPIPSLEQVVKSIKEKRTKVAEHCDTQIMDYRRARMEEKGYVID